MTEDDLYRTSTQYRLWSFTADTLVSLRTSTNAVAAERVRAAIQRAREAAASKNGSEAARTPSGEIDCLTVEEEQKLVAFYCVQAMKLADFCSLPTNVKVGTLRGMDSQTTSSIYLTSKLENRLRRYNILNDSISPTVR